MFRKIILTVFMAAITGFAYAQSSSSEGVEHAAETLRLAMISGDAKVLDQIAFPELTYGHSGGHVDDKKEFVEKIASGKSAFVTIDISEQTITVMKDVAILRHRFHAETNDKGVPGKVDLLVMMVWHKDHKEWKLLARQAVKAK